MNILVVLTAKKKETSVDRFCTELDLQKLARCHRFSGYYYMQVKEITKIEVSVLSDSKATMKEKYGEVNLILVLISG